MLSSICVLAILQTQSIVQKPLTPAQPGGPSWKSIVTKIGATISTPIDLGKPALQGASAKNPSAEAYSPKAWSGCSLKLSRRAFGKEDPDDSTAVKLEDVVYNELDLDGDRITKVSFGVLQGWPEVDVEAKKKDDTLLRYRVVRTKSLFYVVILGGSALPTSDVVNKLFGSFRLPKDVAAGKLTSWGPEPATAKLADGKLEVWTPIAFKDSDDYPDFSDDGGTGEGHAGEFGYSNYRVGIVNLPAGMEDRLDEDAVDHLIHTKFDEDDDGTKVTFGEFKSSTVGPLSYRTVTYVDDTLEGRVDIVIKDSKLYMFAVTVPRGMLNSEVVKKFFASIAIH